MMNWVMAAILLVSIANGCLLYGAFIRMTKPPPPKKPRKPRQPKLL